MTSRSFILSASFAVVPALAGCGQEPPSAPETAVLPADRVFAAGASERIFYKVKLAPLGDSRARGMLLLEIVGGQLTVRVHANGVEPQQRIPQHIHVNPTCDPGGGILINLDANLTVAGEAPGIGAAYPLASRAGVVNYRASRPLGELMGAVNQFAGAGLETVEDLLEWLDLENRNAHMHVAFGPPFPAVNCGEIERVN